jgi:hypothetical protein
MQMYEVRTNAIYLARFNGGPLEPVRVEKVKIKKILVTRESGERWDVYPSSLHPNEDNVPFNLALEEATGLEVGSVVRFTSPEYKAKYPAPYVVTAKTQDGFRLSKLFGDGGRYFRSMPATHLEKMSPEDLTEYLVDA